MSQNNSDGEQVSLKSTDLEELRRSFRAIVDLRDRKYGFPAKTYANCFIGSEAVAKLIEKGLAADEDDAVRIGNVMLHSGIFHHVQRAHVFKNEYLFYRFASDEDHGGIPDQVPEGSSVKWADFLGTLTKVVGADGVLQPSLPGPDAELAEKAQKDPIGVSPLDNHNAQLLDNVHPKKSGQTAAKILLQSGGNRSGAVVLVSWSVRQVSAPAWLLLSRIFLGVTASMLVCRLRLCCAVLRRQRQVVMQARLGKGRRRDFRRLWLCDEAYAPLKAQISPWSAKRYSDQLGVDFFMGRGVFTGKNTIEEW